MIDDHAMVREGFVLLLRHHDEDVQIDEAGSLAEAMIYKDRAYDFIWLDLKLPDARELDGVAAIRAAFPEVPLVVVSAEEDPAKVRQAIGLGAMSFVPKAAPSIMLKGAIQLVLQGRVCLPGCIRPDTPARKLTGLTAREQDVMRFLIQGKSNKAIMRELALSESGVKKHLEKIYRTLGVHNRTEAVVQAAERGLVL